MENVMVPGDHRQPCCKNPLNMRPFKEREDLVINKCRMCGRRHFELTLDPGQFFARLARIGG